MIRWPNSAVTLMITSLEVFPLVSVCMWLGLTSPFTIFRFNIGMTLQHQSIGETLSFGMSQIPNTVLYFLLCQKPGVESRQEITDQGTWRLEPISLLRPFESSEAESWKLSFCWGGNCNQHPSTHFDQISQNFGRQESNRSISDHAYHAWDVWDARYKKFLECWNASRDLSHNLLWIHHVLRQLDVTVWVGTSTGTPPALRDAACWRGGLAFGCRGVEAHKQGLIFLGVRKQISCKNTTFSCQSRDMYASSNTNSDTRQHTGSLWTGCDFSAGQQRSSERTWVPDITYTTLSITPSPHHPITHHRVLLTKVLVEDTWGNDMRAWSVGPKADLKRCIFHGENFSIQFTHSALDTGRKAKTSQPMMSIASCTASHWTSRYPDEACKTWMTFLWDHVCHLAVQVISLRFSLWDLYVSVSSNHLPELCQKAAVDTVHLQPGIRIFKDAVQFLRLAMSEARCCQSLDPGYLYKAMIDRSHLNLPSVPRLSGGIS